MLKRATRMLHIVAAILGSYCAFAVLVIAWPVSGIVAAIAAIGLFVKKRQSRLTTLGSARWADAKDIKRAGMLNAKTGVILGRINGEKSLVRLHQAVHTVAMARTGTGKSVGIVIPHFLPHLSPALLWISKANLLIKPRNFDEKPSNKKSYFSTPTASLLRLRVRSIHYIS